MSNPCLAIRVLPRSPLRYIGTGLTAIGAVATAAIALWAQSA